MRRLVFLTVAALLLSTTGVHSQDIACTPTVPLTKQHRTNLKLRDPAGQTAEVHELRVSQMLRWAQPQDVADPKRRRLDEPLTERETQVYSVEGDLWRVKVEDNDCDFHLELSVPGRPKTASRIIVEIPQGQAFLEPREKILEALTANGYGVAVAKAVNLDEPLRVSVTGYAFYDSAHYSKKNPLKGHNHGTKYIGTLWELHPVWKIVFADGQ